MFRKSCFGQSKGCLPLLFGGEDWLVQIDAKQAGGGGGYTLQNLSAYHYRSTSSADRKKLKGLFRLGMMDTWFGSILSLK
jgi:hypothetical protein